MNELNENAFRNSNLIKKIKRPKRNSAHVTNWKNIIVKNKLWK